MTREEILDKFLANRKEMINLIDQKKGLQEDIKIMRETEDKLIRMLEDEKDEQN